MGKTYEGTVKLARRDSSSLVVTSKYGEIIHDLSRVTVVSETPVTKDEWRAQKADELAELEQAYAGYVAAAEVKWE